jgi:hypothetical protein
MNGSTNSPVHQQIRITTDSPAAAPDPRRDDAVLIGTGRFAAGAPPAYWLPSIPQADGASGGHVVAFAGAAAYLTFDSRLYFTSDGGQTWYPERWAPWAPRQDALALLWYDERRDAAPAVYLARWSERTGWQSPHQIPLAGRNAPSIDQALATADGKWLLLGPCRGSVLDALVVDPVSGALRRPPIALRFAGDD